MTETKKFTDYPFYEIAAAVEEHAAKGCNCFQKFTCEQCGSRQTIDVPNTLYTRGVCEECGHETNILATGCNYLLTASSDNAGYDHALDYIVGGKKAQH